MRIVVIGGGFAGVFAARALEQQLRNQPDAEITLISRENFLLFTPMLHEVAAADLDVTHIVNPIRKLLRRARFFHGTVLAIDPVRREVLVSHGVERDHPHHIGFDHLVLALGSVTNFYGIPGLQDRAFTLKSLGDALGVRNRLIDALEEADFECCLLTRRRMLTFAVAGGGFAGVEAVAAINDFLRSAVRHYPHLKPSDVRVVLIHSGERILPELSPKLGRFAGDQLARRGVELQLSQRVRGFSSDGVELGNGTVIETANLIWTAGTAPHPLLESLPFPKQNGRVVVDRCLRVEGWQGVWALGDCAVVPDGRGGVHPPTAQHATRQGKRIAANIAAALRGEAPKPFEFRSLGMLATIGRRCGVAEILGLRFSGFLAWWLWRTIYLAKLPRLERKLRVALDWTLDLLFSKDLVKCPTAMGGLGLARITSSDELVRVHGDASTIRRIS